MVTNYSAFSVLLAMMVLALFLFNSPAAFAAEDDPRGEAKPPARKRPGKAYQVVHDFCNQRNSVKDREFCIRALESDPRSAAAADLVGLLKISVDLAVKNANRTQHFLASLSKNRGRGNRALTQALKECSAAYDWCLKELQIIPRELLDDTALASYDALMASDALKSCKDSLGKRKISKRSIWTRHRIATEYVQLCVDISRSI